MRCSSRLTRLVPADSRDLAIGLLDDIREAAARVAAEARSVRIDADSIPAYAEALPADAPGLDPGFHVTDGPAETRAAFSLTLDAVNFGSGWFPTIRKRPGCSGYHTVALGLRERFADRGPWSAAELASIEPGELAAVLGQDPEHELISLFVASLRDLGSRVRDELAGRFRGLAEEAGNEAESIVERVAAWRCFSDRSSYRGTPVPLYKRAQIAVLDLHLAGAARVSGLERLTLFADNLVPHVLRLDGVTRWDPGLISRIERGELLEHGSEEEVEMRATAIHAAELICAERPDLTPQEVDRILWNRGGGPVYKAIPRPRCRTTAY